MPVCIYNFKSSNQYSNFKVELVFRLKSNVDGLTLKKLILSVVKDLNLDLFYYAEEVWKDKFKGFLFDEVYWMSIEIEDYENSLFRFRLQKAFDLDIFSKARELKGFKQDEICKKVNIGRTTLFKLESDHRYRLKMRKLAYDRICAFYQEELKILNYYTL